jgi:hypothetical protein
MQIDQMPKVRIAVEDGFDLLWDYHFVGKPSARPFASNKKALCTSFGKKGIDEITEPDFIAHLSAREHGMFGFDPVGPQTRKHDINIWNIMLNVFRRWARKGYKFGGVDFSRVALPEFNPTEDIKRPKTFPRKQEVTPEDVARWMDHAPKRLYQRTCFAIDTGLNPIDLKRLRTSQYIAAIDCLKLQRSKTGVAGYLPVTDRCREVILEAIAMGREKILIWTNHDKEVEATRIKSGVYFWFGRDLRTTFYNEVLEGTDRNYQAAARAMLHADTRTGPAHYEVDDGEDLRPAFVGIEKKFARSQLCEIKT